MMGVDPPWNLNRAVSKCSRVVSSSGGMYTPIRGVCWDPDAVTQLITLGPWHAIDSTIQYFDFR